MQAKRLISLYGRYEIRSRSLIDRFAAKLPANLEESRICEPIHQDGRTYLVVRLQQLWGEFCRELIVRSAIGGCLTRTSQTLPGAPGVKRVSDILKIIKLNDLGGPAAKWEEPSFAIDQAMRLKVANFNGIDLGLGQASAVASHIKVIRNYIVHPNSRNSNQYTNMARSLGFRGLSPDQLLSQTAPGSNSVFENWLSTLTLAAWNAVA